MRKVALVFATLFLLATAGLGLLGANRGIKDAKDIAEVYGESKAAIAAAGAASPELGELARLGERTGSLKAGAIIFGLAGVLALVLLVTAYARTQVVPVLAVVVVVAALAGTFLSPQYDLGPMAPASARSLGYVITALAVLGAGAAYGAALARRRRQATV